MYTPVRGERSKPSATEDAAVVSTRDVIIQAHHLDAARAFYRDVMRLEQTPTDMLGFETGSFRLYIEPGNSPGPVFEFEVEDLQSAKALLLAHGCTVAEEDAMLPRLYIRDPFGLVFNITEGDRRSTRERSEAIHTPRILSLVADRNVCGDDLGRHRDPCVSS
jgi:hypothetical protein